MGSLLGHREQLMSRTANQTRRALKIQIAAKRRVSWLRFRFNLCAKIGVPPQNSHGPLVVDAFGTVRYGKRRCPTCRGKTVDVFPVAALLLSYFLGVGFWDTISVFLASRLCLGCWT